MERGVKDKLVKRLLIVVFVKGDRLMGESVVWLRYAAI
jgi:hypothetical protein